MDYKTEEQVLFVSFVWPLFLLLTTGACLLGCAYGGCLTAALPATRETATQSKSLLFCNDSDKIFFQMPYLKGVSERNLTFITDNLSLLSCAFRGELGRPVGSLCCHSLLPAHCLLLPITVPFRSCWYSCFCKLAWAQTNKLMWLDEGEKRVSHPKQKVIAVCLPSCSSVFTGYLLLPKEPLLT